MRVSVKKAPARRAVRIKGNRKRVKISGAKKLASTKRKVKSKASKSVKGELVSNAAGDKWVGVLRIAGYGTRASAEKDLKRLAQLLRRELKT